MRTPYKAIQPTWCAKLYGQFVRDAALRATASPEVIMRVRLFTFIVAIVLVTGYWLPATRTVGAQEDDIKTQALISVNLASATLPPAPAFLRLVRITLEPGATSVAHTHPGPEI